MPTAIDSISTRTNSPFTAQDDEDGLCSNVIANSILFIGSFGRVMVDSWRLKRNVGLSNSDSRMGWVIEEINARWVRIETPDVVFQLW
jgi:hypothetical protein